MFIILVQTKIEIIIIFGEQMRSKEAIQSANEINRMEKFPSQESLPNMYLSHCRICLQQQGKLVQLPCACIGELGLVHESCFTKWVETIRNQSSAFRSHANNLRRVQENFYQISCQICKAQIKLQIVQNKACIGVKDLKKPEVIFSIVCILFSLGLLGISAFLCISSIVRDSSNGLKIFVNSFILLVLFLVLGFIIKKQASRLIVSNIITLSISFPPAGRNPNNKNDQQIFVIHQDQISTPSRQNEDNNDGNTSNRSNGSKRSRRSNRRRQKNANAIHSQNMQEI